jgi:cholesterol oxidase
MREPARYDVVVIGSGFGGSVAALRLAEKGYRVAVLEAGRRFASDDFPRTSWDLRRFLWFPRLGLRGIQRINLLRDVMVLSGAGVGGGSLVYANTLYEPHDAFFTDRQWGDITDWKRELAPHFAQARRMLGSARVPFETPADGVVRRVAQHLGVESTFQPTDVAVWFGDRDIPVDDPYFGGEGPGRTGCLHCGGCMVGCRHDAKNTLDRNYLYLAERRGVAVFPEHEVHDLQPVPGGYQVTTRRPGAWVRRQPRRFLAAQVVFAAGALGTTRLLLELQARGRLAAASRRVGHLLRTNSESIVGAMAKTAAVDYSTGVAITSSIHPTSDTNIEPVRYPKGSNSMGLLSTLHVRGGAGPRLLGFLAAVVRHPVVFLRSMSVRRWSERTVILLVMQSRDNSLRAFLRDSWLGRRLTTRQGHGEPNPTYLPVASDAAEVAAAAIGGYAGSSINEAVLDTPMTAHILGGACIGATPERGVVDPYHRLYGHPGLHVIDGSAVPANLGANPSLTITALAERAMSLWPNRGDVDPRPPVGDAYRPVEVVAPRSPAVPRAAPAALWYDTPVDDSQ